MLGDHYYSSCEADKTWKTSLSLVANTDPKTKQAKQYLDEHLVRVSDNAMRVAQALSRLADEMESAYDIQKLKKKSPQGFEWQDQAVKGIQQFIQKMRGVRNKVGLLSTWQVLEKVKPLPMPKLCKPYLKMVNHYVMF